MLRYCEMFYCISPNNQSCFHFTCDSRKPFLEEVVSRREFFFTNRLLQILLRLWQKIQKAILQESLPKNQENKKSLQEKM